MAQGDPIPGGVDTGQEYGPTRESLKTRDAQANVDPNAYAGQEVHPNHKDKFLSQEYNRKQKIDKKIERDRQQVEDRQKRDEWREHNRKEKEEAVKKEKERVEQEKERKKKEKLKWKPRGGIEIPKQGVGRISRASEGLSNALLSEPAFDYSDAFSMGGELGGLTHSVRHGLGIGVPDFSGQINMFGQSRRGRGRQKGDGEISTGFGGYQSPFAGMFGTPIKRGKRLSATGSLTGGIFGKRRKNKKIGDIFSLRLF